MHNRYREEEKQETKLKNTIDGEAAPETAAPEATEVETEVSFPTKEEIEELTAEIKKLNDLYLRTLADAENYKKRINEERIRERKYGAQRIFEKMISVLDVFDQALNVETDDQKLKNFLIGFTMINKQLKEIAEEEGVKKIEALNQKFDPTYHHAMEVEYNEEKDDNIVLEVYQNGYTYKDRVLRPALVKVNKSKKEEDLNNE
ncbi:MAG: nucleotide exchange factor GrpE [Bacilli bacterium]|nr:nucleotide exchange factor GrpE [Bacilli bacterium]MDD4388810.1 nucleotide exchange factor GrpE [Bacilli bacterium]